MQPSENPYAAPGSEPLRDTSTERHYGPASSAQRVINYIVDRLSAYALLFVLSLAWGTLAPASASVIEDSTVLGYLLSAATMLVYYTLLEGLTGRTLGKVVTSTKVVGARGGIPAFHQIVIRSLSRFIPLEAFTFLSNDKPGLHDRLSKTVVVRLKPSALQRAMEES